MSKNTSNPTEAKHSTKAAILESLSAQNFANFGLNQIAYIKMDDELEAENWVLHGADGRTLAIYDNPEQAIRAALESDMKPVRLH